tara:strand:+ start:1751 stop:3379 length:1629 start_codon:yes stop_codon:yes gene_type:complete
MFKEEIIKLLSKQINLKPKEIQDLVEIPPNQDLGDYAFPCFILSKKLKKSPKDIAEDLSKKLKPTKNIESIKPTGPYINFFIDKKKLAEHIININSGFGRQKQNEKILLEHTSVNPNASPHVGRARNSIIGDSIYRILSFLGNKVERHYYVNDVSKQIAILALVFKPTDKFDDLLKKYVDITKKLEKNSKLEKQVFELLHKFEHKDKKTVALFKKIVETAVKGQKKVFSSIGINFDYFDYESRYIEEGKHILKQLEQTKKLFKDDEGRMVLDQKLTPLVTKMRSPVLVLTRSDGTGLYPLRDLAYTIEKTKKERNILILGEDQKVYFEQISEALKLLKKPVPEVVHYSFVLLKGIGKMATRRGELVLLEEFLNQAKQKAEQEIKKRKTKGDANKVAIAAVKYAMLRNENNKNITFNINESLRFEGDTGPYLQYTYARASSIIRKAKKSTSKMKIEKLSKSEIQLITKISLFPEIVERAGINMNPSLIANYSHELAQAFNEFYHNNKVIGSDEESFRLKLVDAFRTCLKNSLYLLGIDVMEAM